eukprot:538003-Amphidinium_carterae.1
MGSVVHLERSFGVRFMLKPDKETLNVRSRLVSKCPYCPISATLRPCYGRSETPKDQGDILFNILRELVPSEADKLADQAACWSTARCPLGAHEVPRRAEAQSDRSFDTRVLQHYELRRLSEPHRVNLGSVDDYASRVLIEACVCIRELRLDETLTAAEDPFEFVADGARKEKGGKGRGKCKESCRRQNKRKTVLCRNIKLRPTVNIVGVHASNSRLVTKTNHAT